MKFSTDNGYPLFVKSMNKLHKVEHFSFDQEEHDNLFKTKDLIAVGSLPGYEDVDLLAQVYSGDRNTKLSDFNCESFPYTNLYFLAFGKYFQVASIVTSVEHGNEILKSRSDLGLLCTTTMPCESQYHFLVSLAENRKVA